MDQYVKKGMLIAVDGRIQTRNYENKDGNKVYVTEVICENMRMLGSKNSNDSGTYLDDYEPTNNKSNVAQNESDTEFVIDDDSLPF